MNSEGVAVPGAHATDLHRPSRSARRCDQLYQIHSRVRATHVVVEERVDGTLRMLHQDRPLTYQRIMKRPPAIVSPTSPRQSRLLVKPKPDHPWNRVGKFATARPREAI